VLIMLAHSRSRGHSDIHTRANRAGTVSTGCFRPLLVGICWAVSVRGWRYLLFLRRPKAETIVVSLNTVTIAIFFFLRFTATRRALRVPVT
jgi:hypothetical protein